MPEKKPTDPAKVTIPTPTPKPEEPVKVQLGQGNGKKMDDIKAPPVSSPKVDNKKKSNGKDDEDEEEPDDNFTAFYKIAGQRIDAALADNRAKWEAFKGDVRNKLTGKGTPSGSKKDDGSYTAKLKEPSDTSSKDTSAEKSDSKKDTKAVEKYSTAQLTTAAPKENKPEAPEVTSGPSGPTSPGSK